MNELNKSANKTVSYTIPSFYNHYLSNIEADTVYDIDYPTYRKIVSERLDNRRKQKSKITIQNGQLVDN